MSQCSPAARLGVNTSRVERLTATTGPGEERANHLSHSVALILTHTGGEKLSVKSDLFHAVKCDSFKPARCENSSYIQCFYDLFSAISLFLFARLKLKIII